MKTWIIASFVVLGLGGAVGALAPQDEEKQDVYDEQADAKADIEAALARAAKENRRVLLVWGANWCGWCVKLHTFFEEDPDVSRKLFYEYDVVKIDIGKNDKNLDLAKRYGATFQKEGVPFLTVLDAKGAVLANQETGALEDGPKHDQEKVLAFLTEHQAPYPKAADVRRAGAEAGHGGQEALDPDVRRSVVRMVPPLRGLDGSRRGRSAPRQALRDSEDRHRPDDRR